MVSKRLQLIAVCGIFGVVGIFAVTTVIGCGGTDGGSSSHIISGSGLPFLIEADPDAAGAGETVTLTGNGFSFAAPENVVAVGGTALSAEAYDINDDGAETLVFTLPASAAEGETELVLIVGGKGSNTLPFTVLPSP